MLQIKPVPDLRNKLAEDEADIQAASTKTRLSHDEVFSKARSLVKSK